MTTTTLTTIVNKMAAVIVALTPTAAPATRLFQRSTAPNLPFRRWALQAGGLTLFRMFEITRIGRRDELGVTDPSATLVRQNVRVTIAYPMVPKNYGRTDVMDMESLIEVDAHQVLDVLWSVGGLAGAGHQTSKPAMEEPDRSDDRIWFQDLTTEVTFYTARTP